MSVWRYAAAVGTLVLAILAVEATVGRAVPLAGPLEELPFSFGGWSGQTTPVPAEAVRRTRPDGVLSRRYLDAHGNDAQLYIAYYGHEAARAQILATCEGECQLLKTGTERIATARGGETINRVLVRQDGNDYVVLYWFEYGSQIVDASRAKLGLAWRALSTRRSDGALVRVSSRVFTTEAQAAEHAATFTELLLPHLRQYLPE